MRDTVDRRLVADAQLVAFFVVGEPLLDALLQAFRQVERQKPAAMTRVATPAVMSSMQAQDMLVVVVELADDARAHIGAPVEQLLLDLVFDDLAALLDDEHLLKPFGEMAHALGLERPGHADLHDAQADGVGRFLSSMPRWRSASRTFS